MQIEDVLVYQISVELRQEIHKAVNAIPRNWVIEDIRQIRRSSSSVPSNITEGFSRRFYPKDYIRFLNIALGSSDETKSHIQALTEGGYLAKEKSDYLRKRYKDLSIRINNLIGYFRKKYSKIGA